jgi:hypothetical protein
MDRDSLLVTGFAGAMVHSTPMLKSTTQENLTWFWSSEGSACNILNLLLDVFPDPVLRIWKHRYIKVEDPWFA